MSSIPFPQAITLSERFTAIVAPLARVIGAYAARHPAKLPLLLLVTLRLRRLMQRFTALAARAAAGTLPGPRPPRTTPRPPRPPPSQPRQHLPSRIGWLSDMIQEAQEFGPQLRWNLLADRELAALLELAPQAGRLLRPLCRMLLVDPVPLLGFPSPRARRTGPAEAEPPAAAEPPATAESPAGPARTTPPDPAPPDAASSAPTPPVPASTNRAPGIPDALRLPPPRPPWGRFFKSI